jgi:putative toxin-antitoxin system antitoxin component (TIGR02293 family)
MRATADSYKPDLEDHETAPVRAMRRVSEIAGTHLRNTLDEIRLIQTGVQPALLESLKQLGLSPSESHWIIKPRTLAHRKSKKELLTQEETERWLRAIKIVALAIEVFGNQEKATQWLHKSRSRFGEHSALEIMQNEPGAQLVEETLNQIDSGYFA